MDALGYIVDKIVDQEYQMEIKGIRPAYVIIGEAEAEIIIEDERKHPTIAGPASQKSQLMGLEVVVDYSCRSRVEVVEGFSLANWRRRHIERSRH